MTPKLTDAYRGKRLENGKWFFGRLLNLDDERTALTDGNFVALVEPKTLCRHIGLGDKNNKKIYVGDIVRYSRQDEQGQVTHQGVVVIYKTPIDTFIFIEDSVTRKMCAFGQCDECEVIGNIYDK